MSGPWDDYQCTLEESLLVVTDALGLNTTARLIGTHKTNLQRKMQYGGELSARPRALLREIAWHMRRRETREQQWAWLWEGPPGNTNWAVFLRRANGGPLINPSLWQIWAMDAERERALERPFEEIWENEGGASFAW